MLYFYSMTTHLVSVTTHLVSAGRQFVLYEIVATERGSPDTERDDINPVKIQYLVNYVS